MNRTSSDDPVSQSRSYLRWYLPIPALWLILFSPQLLFGQCFFWYDHLMTNYPFKMFFARAWNQGHFPLWAHEYLCGYPLFASSEATAAYPPSFLLALLPEPWGYSWFVCLHVLGAATGGFLLLKHMKLPAPSALLGGIVYGFSGCLWSRMHQVTVVTGYCWLPFVVLAAVLVAERHSLRNIGLLSLTCALLILGSHPQIALYALAVAGCAGLFWPNGETGRKHWLRFSCLFAVAMALAVGIGAVQFVPFAELLQHTERGTALEADYYYFGSLPPSSLITLLMPNYFGTPANDSYWGHKEPGMYGEMCGYAGLLPLVLAVCAVIRSLRKTTRLFLYAWVVSLLLALGEYFPPYSLLRFLPVFGSTRVSARFLIPGVFALSLLAAEGLRVISEGNAPRHRAGRLLIVSGIALIGIGIAILIARPELLHTERYNRLLNGIPTEVSTFNSVRSAMSPLLGSGFVHFFLVASACLALGIALRRRIGSAVLCGVLIAIVTIDLAAFDWPMNPYAPKEVVLREPVAAQAIHARQTTGRLHVVSELVATTGEHSRPFSAGWFGNGSEYIGCTEMLDGNLPLLYRLDSINGMTTLMIDDYKKRLAASEVHGARIRYPIDPGSPLLDTLSVQYILSSHPIDREGLHILASIQDAALYQSPWAYPRAFLTTSWTNYEESYQPEGEFSPTPQISVLDGPPRVEEATETFIIPVADVEYSSNQVQVRWPGGADGLLVMLDTHYPGWKASVNGRDEPIWKVNDLFRAVRVQPEDKELTLTYEPRSVRIGLAVTLISFVIVLALAIFGKGNSEAGPVDSPEAKPLPKWTIPAIVLCSGVLCIAPHPGKWAEDMKNLSFSRYVAGEYVDLGVLYAERGRLSEAERLWRSALSIDPDSESASKNLEILKDRSR